MEVKTAVSRRTIEPLLPEAKSDPRVVLLRSADAQNLMPKRHLMQVAK